MPTQALNYFLFWVGIIKSIYPLNAGLCAGFADILHGNLKGGRITFNEGLLEKAFEMLKQWGLSPPVNMTLGLRLSTRKGWIFLDLKTSSKIITTVEIVFYKNNKRKIWALNCGYACEKRGGFVHCPLPCFVVEEKGNWHYCQQQSCTAARLSCSCGVMGLWGLSSLYRTTYLCRLMCLFHVGLGPHTRPIIKELN